MRIPPPQSRPLRVYAFDPTLLVPLDAAIANEVTVKVPWEDLTPGPIGDYVEVIDFDPASDSFYAPVDLNEPALAVQEGLPPAEGVPQFHQQMVYALVMTTIRHFERALGRTILWSPRVIDRQGTIDTRFVQRLRIYPHALNARQAFYSPSKKALLMGYAPVDASSTPGSSSRTTAFMCLSHATVAHETVHAVLDGLGRAVTLEDAVPDQLAVQEAIGDLVGLFQQFSMPGFLRRYVSFTADADENQKRLEALARKLAQTAGGPSALRDAIGTPPAPFEPRRVKFEERSALIVAALFEMFVAVWRARATCLLGVAASREPLHDDLLDMLSSEAARCASHVLRMCIRAIDYCPPVDLTVGDYLRALVTADADLFFDDERRYRVAMVEAFRQRGLCAYETPALSPLRLMWRPPVKTINIEQVLQLGSESPLEPARELAPPWARHWGHRVEYRLRTQLHAWLMGLDAETTREMGLALGPGVPATIVDDSDGRRPAVRVDSCRLAHRAGRDGRILTDWVITITQQRRGYVDPADQDAQEANGKGSKRKETKAPDFMFRGGCTLLVDAVSGVARFCIAKDILAANRLARQREAALQYPATQKAPAGDRTEPFSMLRGGPSVAV